MPKKESDNNFLLQYAALTTQLLVSLGVAVYAGYWLDKKINIAFPLLVWILPLLTIFVSIYKIIKDTSSKK
ncbi:MAG: AtpZ/AtpI family protein [Sphingobacteriia bacterium]|nr:AtpZ/AtpI family protein [Sphingobacteriia bacterium]